LGQSLGINVLSATTKVCTLNCLYCQYGFTNTKNINFNQKNLYLPVEYVFRCLEIRLKNDTIQPDYITFSGNGEATLHPEFSDLVAGVTALRNRYRPITKTAILSNGTQLIQQNIRDAIDKLDVKIIKFDSADYGLFKRYNRPVFSFNLEQFIEVLTAMKNTTLQALFTGGTAGNVYPEHLNIWIKTVQRIRPIVVQIYSLDRGYQSQAIIKLRKEDLQPVVDQLVLSGIPARAY
jgi:wyosine [tRNA(Phe)-imidazoG37] synthetase (radical SAM superfamily)